MLIPFSQGFLLMVCKERNTHSPHIHKLCAYLYFKWVPSRFSPVSTFLLQISNLICEARTQTPCQSAFAFIWSTNTHVHTQARTRTHIDTLIC